MGPAPKVLDRRARRSGAAAAVGGTLAVLVTLCGPAGSAGAAVGCTGVIGPASTTPAQLAGWFATTGRRPRLDVSVLELATMFVDEGAREGVRGDIAFAQAIVETGYFGFSPSVPPEQHNYSGIGATGGGVRGAGFPDARTGVRAQVQHLRAYADPSLRSAADLKAPLVDPRFGFLVPNPRVVPCWEQFGSGVWAADPTGYGPRVLSVHQRIAAFPDPTPRAPEPAAPPPEVAPVAVTPVPVAEAPATEVAELSEGQMPTLADVIAADVASAPALIVAAATQAAPAADVAEVTELSGRPALASRTAGGGIAGALASLLAGGALLGICTTLWWRGRRFARVG